MNPKNLQTTIDKAERLYAKGKYQSALDTYEQISEFAKHEPKIFLRLGDISRRIGNTTTAIDHYRDAAKAYVQQGFIVKAIAVTKVILNLDPSREDIESNLAALYLKKNIQQPQPGADPSTLSAQSKTNEGQASPLPSGDEATEPVKEERVYARDGEGLQRTPLFSDLGPDELTGIIRKLKGTVCPKDEFVFRRGGIDNAIYIITSGELEIISFTKYSEEIKSAPLKEGDFFGENEYFSGTNRVSDARAITDLELLEISKDDMDSLAAEHPGIHKVLYDFYKERVLDKSLAISKLFKTLSAEDRKELLEHVQVKSFPKGTAVIRENDEGDNMYVIVSGIAEVWKKGRDGARIPLITLQDNDYFGEAAVVLDRPRLSNVTAISSILDLISIDGTELEKVFTKYPEIKTIIEDVAKRHVEVSGN